MYMHMYNVHVFSFIDKRINNKIFKYNNENKIFVS